VSTPAWAPIRKLCGVAFQKDLCLVARTCE
jgi:hypothetical protein